MKSTRSAALRDKPAENPPSINARAVVRETVAADFMPASIRPPLTLVLGPAGAGKTEWTLNRFAAESGSALLVVASGPQAETRAAQLAALTGQDSAQLRARILPFHALVGELTAAQPDAAPPIGRPFQLLILGDVVRQQLRADDYFGPMQNAPGFVPALAERVREWKLARLTPEALAAAVSPAVEQLNEPVFARKAEELARLYQAYERFLQTHGLSDEEDQMLRAIGSADAGLSSLLEATSLILVDGFYRFHRAQRDLLHALAYRGQLSGRQVALTLPYDSTRPLLSAAPERTLCALRQAFACEEITLSCTFDPATPVLSTLSLGLFAPSNAPAVPAPVLRSGEAETLQIFDAPNPYVEAEMVARAFRRLHDTRRYSWNDFAVILRGMGDYAPILAAVFERYAIPLGVDGPERLTENPLLKTLLHLLDVLRRGWQREDVLAFLKSSYTAPDKLEADSLRRLATRKGVRAGKVAWRALAAHLPQRDDPESLAAILERMAEADAQLTMQPEEPSFFADCIVQLCEGFGLLERIAQGEPLRQQRDRAAYEEATRVMHALTRMARLSGRGRMSFAAFHDELRQAWEHASALALPEGDLVRVSEPYDARERPIKIAAIMGLTERVFPRRILEDPFLRDEERLALRQAAGIELEPQKARSDDERFLFYLAVTAPSERLILSFPRSTNESDALPSFYLDDVRAVFTPETTLHTVSRTLADVAPRAHEAVSAHDRLLAACADLFDPGNAGEEGQQALRQAVSQIETILTDPQEAAILRAVLASRHRPRLPRLDDPQVRAAFSQQKRAYSVSELETYARCPFQYLMRHVMRLRPEMDGGSARAEGTLLHAVLRRHYRARQQTPQAAPLNEEELRADLDNHLAATLEQAALDLSPHRLRMTQRVLTQALHGFARREVRFTSQFGMTPTHFELAFGLGEPGVRLRDDDERDEEAAIGAEYEPDHEVNGDRHDDYDPASRREPLEIQSPDTGEIVRICGVIDRVDFDASGTRALTLDYKLGTPPEQADILRGRSLQLPIYLLAMQQVFHKVGAVACYDSMRETGRRRLHRTEHTNVRQFAPMLPLDEGNMVTPLNREQFQNLVKTTEATAIRLARGIQSGNIEATPGDHCRACAYADVCRTTLAGHDGEPLPLAVSHPSPPQ